jgi:hypothetical protein
MLVSIFGEMVEQASQLMVNSQEFFPIFVDYMHEQRRSELENSG